jgi:hypothetical protein
MNLDESLKRALEREAPPPGFRERVMRRAMSAPQRRAVPRWRAAAAVLLLTGGTIAGVTARYVQRQREGERARAQVMFALRLAGQKVHYAREEVRDTLKGTAR